MVMNSAAYNGKNRRMSMNRNVLIECKFLVLFFTVRCENEMIIKMIQDQ